MLQSAAAADELLLKTYYRNALGKKGAELKSAMKDIISQADVLAYGSGQGKTWFGFYQTDRMANDQVRDRYSNEQFFFSTANPYSAVSGMNIEHAVANSWWNHTKNQAYKDLHHLMPCESRINSSKGNFGMGRVTTVKNTNQCTKVGTGPGADGETISLWEPADKWKGDFARVYFYMVTCYSDLSWTSESKNSISTSDWRTLLPWAYELYLQWSRQDPVDDIERARNEAVYTIQGNRNPFIDFPELAEHIWGNKANESFSIGDEGGGHTPTPEPEPTPGDSLLVLYQNLQASAGNFATVTSDGTQSVVWNHDTKYGMVGNAYSTGKTGDDWLVTPQINLHGHMGATLEFSHAVGYNNGADPSTMFEVLVSTDYAQRPDDATWERLDVQWPSELLTATSKFTKFITVKVNLDGYAHRFVNIAFHYTADASRCWAWEIKSATVKAKPAPTGIDDNYLSPIADEDAVFDINGNYIGREIPSRRGIYIVRRGGYTFKRIVR